MSVTVDQALDQLNFEDTEPDTVKLELFVDAANDWVESKVTDSAPPSISTLATLLLIQHWWERSQRGTNPPAASDPYADIEGRTYAIPNEVRELLDGYLSGSVRPSPTGEFPDAVSWPDPVEWPA